LTYFILIITMNAMACAHQHEKYKSIFMVSEMFL